MYACWNPNIESCLVVVSWFFCWKGTGQIEIICVDFPSFEELEIEWDGDAFKKMKNLRTLIIRNGHFSKGPKHLPNSLRVMEWWRYPSQNFPQDFHPKKLAIFKLPYCEFTSLELTDLLRQASVLSSFPCFCNLITSLQGHLCASMWCLYP